MKRKKTRPAPRRPWLRCGQALEGCDTWVYTTVDKDDAASLREDMKVIMAVVVAVILLVLLFTSGTYTEIFNFSGWYLA